MSNTQKNINNVDETEIKNNYQLCLDQYNQLKNEYNAQENLLNKTINEINNIEKTIQNLEIEINNLKKNNIGKASFLILEKITWVENIQKRHFQLPAQNCQRLFDLIRYTNPELKNAFYFAMRDTLVTDNIKNAMKIAYGTTRHRVVT